MRIRNILIFALFVGLIAGCSTAPHQQTTRQDGPPKGTIPPKEIQEIKPKYEPYSKYGNPPSYVVYNKRYYTKRSAVGHTEMGIASWYGDKFHGQRTSSGEIYNMYELTAAHKTLPLPTYAKVTNLENNKTIIIKINDRGPFHDGRIIDLSYVAAKRLGFVDKGTARVRIDAITFPEHSASSRNAPKATEADTPRHYIQVGAFKNRQSAEQLQGRLKTLHNSAKITNDSTRQSALYRVRLGPFLSRDEATQLASAVDSIGLKPFIITE